jgi:alanyl-tRNA synthetase
MTSSEIRKRFLDFFAKRGHAILPSASLVPKNDPSVLFNTAGMQPLVPYLMGEKHPLGKRLASCQKCVRTGDIEEVGNNKNLTFFEMLGNWSLGDYFKEDAIKWSYEFLTSKEEGLGLDPARLYVTVFEGDADAPRDMEAVEIWKQYIPENRIYFLPKKNNWWSAGDNGPCGPDTEMFYDVTGTLGRMTHDEYVVADDTGQVVEIWNDVFMQYLSKDGKVVGQLPQKNIDTGSGLERIAMIVQGKSNVYEADMFAPIMNIIKQKSEKYDESVARIIADHSRSAMFLISDGVFPGNKDQGYILRRLIRRAIFKTRALGLHHHFIALLISDFALIYKDVYKEIIDSIEHVVSVVNDEEDKFHKTLAKGLQILDLKTTVKNLDTGEKILLELNGQNVFDLWTIHGFPPELTIEISKEKGIPFSETAVMKHFKILMERHQDASRAGAEAKFKGGLANTSEMTTKLHTAHHLLLKALQEVVSPDIHQKGSNITEERLRIDFNFDRKLTDEEKQKVEDLVNEKIKEDLSVTKREMPKEEAMKLGAEMEFGTTYPDIVSVYMIHDANDKVFSQEFCGGPHVERTGVLGVFKIQKEEASSAGVRRIKATLS